MCRAIRIPAIFELGFPLPEKRGRGEVPGYHCWAELYLPEIGWIPIDSSEASKNPEKHDYYFGGLCENRVQMSVGRDITLVPKQSGKPLNYFIYPYVEVDGKEYDKAEKRFSYVDLP